MEKSVVSEDGVIVISPEGELDVGNSAKLKEMIETEIDSGRRRIVVDLGRVVYIDSSALGVLVTGLKKMRRRHGSLKLAHLNGSVAKIFHLTRLTQFFEIYDSVEAALSSFDSWDASE